MQKNNLSILRRLGRYKFLLVLTWIYAYSIYLGAVEYLPNQISAPGIFTQAFIEPSEWLLIFAVIIFTTSLIPLRIDRPSSLFAIVIYLFVYLPALVLYAGRGGSIFNIHELFLLISMTIGFCIVAKIPRRMGKFRSKAEGCRAFDNNALIIFSSIISFLLMGYIFANNYQTMRFAGLDEIYLQRDLGRVDLNKTSGLLLGYSKTYLSYLFAPIIFSYGLWRNALRYKIFGFSIFLFCYAIAAERSIFIYPYVIYIISAFVKRGGVDVFPFLIKYLTTSSVIIILISIFYEWNYLLEIIGFLFFTRLIATPGQFVGDYYEYFSDKGYLFWSNFRGLDLLFSPPSHFQGDSLWPYLGWIVGRDLYGINSNLNASFWATDGIAAAGPIGLIFISIVLSIYLYFLDVSSSFWPRQFVIPLAFPLAFVITNGALLTTFVSYGGLALIFILLFFRKTSYIKNKIHLLVV
ncbi:MAG: hypothetical protein H5U28_07425 [Burkholderiaceae bacterium]|nr:hypothetical protein [Burkholderiaceae bacterium]